MMTDIEIAQSAKMQHISEIAAKAEIDEKYVEKCITFEFSHFMSPQSAYLQAGHLYNRYKDYFEITNDIIVINSTRGLDLQSIKQRYQGYISDMDILITLWDENFITESLNALNVA
mgnify:CR=1 FL=1